MGRFRTVRGSKLRSQDEVIDDARQEFVQDLRIMGWTLCDTPADAAKFLAEKCEVDGVYGIESTMAECKVALMSSIDRVMNGEDVAYGSRPAFDTVPNDAEEKRIAAHLIALQMAKVGLTPADIPMEVA